MSWGADVLRVTEDTFQIIKSATAGIDTTTGIAGIDLIDDIMSWVPVDTPFFNSVPRGAGKGATAVFWQTLLNLNASQPDGGVQDNYAASVINLQNQYTYSPYQSVGSGGKVTWDAIAQGEGQADVLAVDTLQTVNQQLLNLEIHQLNAQSFALPAIGNPVLSASTTGGSIATSSVYVRVAPISNWNWYRGNGSGGYGSGPASAEELVAVTGPTGSVSVTVPAVKGCAGYEWFVGDAAGGEFYYTTTYVPTVTITSVPTAAAKVPTTYAGLFNAGQAGPGAVPTTDTSYQTYLQNGLLASILGDWASQPDQALTAGAVANLVTPGSGFSQGAYYEDLGGAQLSVSGAALEQIDTMNRRIYDTYQVTPARMLMGSQVITDIANAVLDNPQAVTWLVPTDADGRARVVAGGHVATYLNKTVNGRPIELHLMPFLPPGQIVSVIDSLPFPGSNVTSALQVRTQYDFFRFDYGANRESGTADGGPRYDFEVRSRQAFVNKAAGIMGVLTGIGAGIA